MNYKLKKSEIIFRGNVFDLQFDEIEYESGNHGTRETVVTPGGAVVLPVTNENKFVLTNQFRHSFKKFMLELPAGRLDKGEDPSNCAIRELEEETGYKAGKLEKLGAISTTPGFCTEVLHIYLATKLQPGKHNREEGEHGMEVFEFSLNEVEEKIKTGEIIDGKTICAFHLALLKNHL